MMRVLHVISNLGQGGAEAVLTRLVTATSGSSEHVVVSLRDEAYFGPRLRAAGIRLYTLNNSRGWLKLRSLFALRKIIIATKPDVVQTWMYHADLIGSLVAFWAGIRSIVWNIRHSNLDSKSSVSSRVVAQLCAWLSDLVPAAIICCSEQAARVHQGMGYCANKFIIIPNGYDLARFMPDDTARVRLRAEWGIDESETLLGVVARWDPQKDQANLLRAISQLSDRNSKIRCVMVGNGMGADNTSIAGLISDLQLNDSVILAGPRDDVPAVMNALDLHVLPSAFGEAFPNVVAEAMACGTPCVVTDVGDAALIVGDAGWVVPPKDPAALAIGIEKAIVALAKKGRSTIGQECRLRIEANFSLNRMLKSYLDLWSNVQERGSI